AEEMACKVPPGIEGAWRCTFVQPTAEGPQIHSGVVYIKRGVVHLSSDRDVIYEFLDKPE
ncbi:hypothetical protein LCGC14_2183920, partial [marine sediment metagenome]